MRDEQSPKWDQFACRSPLRRQSAIWSIDQISNLSQPVTDSGTPIGLLPVPRSLGPAGRTAAHPAHPYRKAARSFIVKLQAVASMRFMVVGPQDFLVSALGG